MSWEVDLANNLVYKLIPKSHSKEYKATNWKKFATSLNKNYTTAIPGDLNLSKEGIDDHLNLISTAITNAIDEIVPTSKPTNYPLKYISPKIKQFQRQKNDLILLFNRLIRTDSDAHLIRKVKGKISQPKKFFSAEFTKPSDSYWNAKVWKCAKVWPILKSGKIPTQSTSYRPISLTPNVSKVFETLINKQIISHCREQKLYRTNNLDFNMEIPQLMLLIN